MGNNKVIFFCFNALYVLTVLPLMGFHPYSQKISLPEFTSFVFSPRTNGNLAIFAGLSGLLVTFWHCKTKIHRRFLPTIAIASLIFSLLHLCLLINSFSSCIHLSDKVKEDIDDFCDKPVERKPIEDYGQVFTVDSSLTGG